MPLCICIHIFIVYWRQRATAASFLHQSSRRLDVGLSCFRLRRPARVRRRQRSFAPSRRSHERRQWRFSRVAAASGRHRIASGAAVGRWVRFIGRDMYCNGGWLQRRRYSDRLSATASAARDALSPTSHQETRD